MNCEIIALSFTMNKQIEIERIATDEDKEGALEFIKNINDEFKRRKTAHCKPMLDWGPNKAEHM